MSVAWAFNARIPPHRDIRNLTGPVCHSNLMRLDFNDRVLSPNEYCDRPAGCRAFRWAVYPCHLLTAEKKRPDIGA